MRQLVLFWLFWGAGAGLATAEGVRPAEMPPGDFPGAQYIDSAGCVFVRAGRDWVAKQDDDGAPTCGFPPSQSAWSSGRAVAPSPSMAEIERALTVSLVEAEGAGIDLAQSPPAAPHGDIAAPPVTEPVIGANPIGQQHDAPVPIKPAPEQGPAAEIARALRAEPALEARMTASSEADTRLCALLGLKPAQKGGLPLGLDPTRGYCAGLTPEALPGRRAVVPHSTGKNRPLKASVESSTTEAGGVPSSRPSRGDSAKKERGTRSATRVPDGRSGVGVAHTAGSGDAGVPAAGLTGAGADDLVGSVPARARYVQIGHFNPDGVTAAIAAIQAMGYPVARQINIDSGSQRIIVAGPFDTRERLVAALNRLRRAGYPHAFAR